MTWIGTVDSIGTSRTFNLKTCNDVDLCNGGYICEAPLIKLIVGIIAGLFVTIFMSYFCLQAKKYGLKGACW